MCSSNCFPSCLLENFLSSSTPSQMAALHAFMYYTPSRLVLVLLAGQFFYADNEGGFNRMFEEMIKDQDIDNST